MTKAEIVEKMQALGILEAKTSRHQLWVEAFRLYNETQKPKLKLTMCSTCFSMVRKWLKS